MAHYLVEIRGDNPRRAARLLAFVGIGHTNPRHDSVTARVHADNAEAAKGQVLAALAGEPFTIGQVREA